MQPIEEYVSGLKIPEQHKPMVVCKLHDAGFHRYDRYYWQQIEDVVNEVVSEPKPH